MGCGKVGDYHAVAYGNLEQVEFAAVCDIDFPRAERFAEKYHVTAYHTIREMVEKEALDMVSICSPHPSHCKNAVEAMQAGANIIVEKPLAESAESATTIIETAKVTGKLVGTVCQRRFYRPCQRIRRAIDEGKLGRPMLGMVVMHGWRDEKYYNSDPWRGSWEKEGGGVLINQAPHQIDLLQWYMGSEIESVSGFWSNMNHPYIDVEDTAVAVLRFRSGALGSIVVSNSQNPALYGKVHIFGDNGASVGVQTDGGAMFIAGMTGITEPPVLDLWKIPGEEAQMELWNEEDSAFFNSVDSTYYYHQLQLEDFAKALLNNTSPLITAKDGLRTVQIFDAIYRSNREHRPIDFT